MKFKEGKSVSPIGEQGIREHRDTLPVVEVKNKVVWINPNLNLPLKLEIGEPASLGLFLNDTQRISKEEITRRLEVDNNHNRSMLLGRIIFGEKKREGRQLFRDIDIKGSGYIMDGSFPSGYTPWAGTIGRSGNQDQDSWGIMDLEPANHDASISEIFNKIGIRVSRVIAIVELDEIVYIGKKISIPEAKRKKLIEESEIPVLEIRAFGTHSRFVDIVGNKNSQEKKDILLEDARQLVAQEVGENPANFDNLMYSKWLATAIGENVGLMHKNGYIHKYLTIHNITLDGCLVDFDAVENSKNKSDPRFGEDRNKAREALRSLLFELYLDPVSSQEIIDEYDISYSKAANPADEKLLKEIETAARKYS